MRASAPSRVSRVFDDGGHKYGGLLDPGPEVSKGPTEEQCPDRLQGVRSRSRRRCLGVGGERAAVL